MRSTDSRSRLWVIVLLPPLAVALLFGLARVRRGAVDGTSGDQAGKMSPPLRQRSANLASPPRATTARTEPEAPVEPGTPLIDEAVVEKTSVCRGEENHVRVKAHTSDGTDAYLYTSMIDPANGAILRGTRIPFRQYGTSDEELLIRVEGRNTIRGVALPPVEVRDCVEPKQVILTFSRTFAVPDRARFHVKLIESPPVRAGVPFEPFVPASYEWDFGDGQTAKTSGPEIEHSYEGRLQNVMQSSFVATVTLRDAKGQEARGSCAVAFTNPGFVPLVSEGRVAIGIGVKPLDSGRETIWLYHGYQQPVRLDRVTLRETVRDDRGGPERETFSRDYAPGEMLGFNELPAGESRTTRDLHDLAPTAPGAIRYVEVTGRTSDGKPARAEFTLLPQRTNPQGG
jgi:hypothetical protein